MIILAIDTALDASSAAVLDTDTGSTHRASRSQTDAARSCRSPDAADRARDEGKRHRLHRARPHRGHHRPRQFHRDCASASRRRAASRWRPAKPVVGLTTLAAYAAPLVAENGAHPILSAIDARHDHVYFQIGSAATAARCSSRRWPRSPRRSRPRNSARCIWSATPRIFSAERWPADAPPPVKVDRQPAPDIAWVAWVGAAVDPDTAPPRPFYLRAPDAKAAEGPRSKSAQPPST